MLQQGLVGEALSARSESRITSSVGLGELKREELG